MPKARNDSGAVWPSLIRKRPTHRQERWTCAANRMPLPAPPTRSGNARATRTSITTGAEPRQRSDNAPHAVLPLDGGPFFQKRVARFHTILLGPKPSLCPVRNTVAARILPGCRPY